MMNKIKRGVLSAFLVSAVLVCPLAAQNETAQTNEKYPVSIDAKTREDMIEEIKDAAMEDEEIFGRVPGLKTEKAEGEEEITYFNGKQDMKLEDLASDVLGELFKKVTAAKKKLDDKWQKQVIETSIDAQKRPPEPPELPPQSPPQPPPLPPKR